MSLELVNTLATFGTFVVIAATAIAAIVQLRHARSSNQIEALAELREEMENEEMQSAHRFIRHELAERLKDPIFRHQLWNLEGLSAENHLSWNQIRRLANCYAHVVGDVAMEKPNAWVIRYHVGGHHLSGRQRDNIGTLFVP
jgi:hypothetical protein